MLNAQEVRGQWDQLRGKVKQKWGQLTDDDLQIVGGNIDELVGRIHQKTGEAREAIETFIGELSSQSTSTLNRARETAKSFAEDATHRVREGYEQVSERMRDGYGQFSDQARERYQQVSERVRENPAQSMLAVFGLGLVTGVLIGVLMRSSDD